MPVPILDNDRMKQLDENVKMMLDSGATEDDVMKYSKDFVSMFGKKKDGITVKPGPSYFDFQSRVPSGERAVPGPVPKQFNYNALEGAFQNAKKADDNLFNATKIAKSSASSRGMGPEVTRSEMARVQQEASNAKTTKEKILKDNANQIYAPIDNALKGEGYKNFFRGDVFDNAKAVEFIDEATRDSGAGSYVKTTMLAEMKKRAQQAYDKPEYDKYLGEAFKKRNVDFNKYGQQVFDRMSQGQMSNLESLKNEADAESNKALESSKLVAGQRTQQFNAFTESLNNQVQTGAIDQNTALQMYNEEKAKFDQSIKEIDRQYQGAVRNINLSINRKYSRIESELKAIQKSVTDQTIWDSLPAEEKKKIQDSYSEAANRLNERKNQTKKSVDEALGLQSMVTRGLTSGFLSGLSQIGGYLNMHGYDNKFTRWLKEQETGAAQIAPAQYEWSGGEWVKRAVSSSTQSIGASLPALVPSVVAAAATGGAGLPTIAGAFTSGLTGYAAESMQLAGDVYNKKLEETGDPNKAFESARRFQENNAVTLPFYFIGGLSTMKLLKGGKVGNVLSGFALEQAEEIPVEYIQNFNEAKENGYTGSFQTFVKENPEIALDVMVTTVGQSTGMAALGKAIGGINNNVPKPDTQFIVDSLQKNGLETTQQILRKYYDTGVLSAREYNEQLGNLNRLNTQQQKYESANITGDKAFVMSVLSDRAKELELQVSNEQDPAVKEIAKQKLQTVNSQITNLAQDKEPYIVLELPGGQGSRRVLTVDEYNSLKESGKIDGMVQSADFVRVINDENLNRELQETKKRVGFPVDAPEGSYQNPEYATQESRQEQGVVPEGGVVQPERVEEGQREVREGEGGRREGEVPQADVGDRAVGGERGVEEVRSEISGIETQRDAEIAAIQAEPITDQEKQQRVADATQRFEAQLEPLRAEAAAITTRELQGELAPQTAIDRVLSQIVPKVTQSLRATNIEIGFVENDEEAAQIEDLGQNQGIFRGKDGKIYINKSRLADEVEAGIVVWHEAAHPVMNILMNTDRPLYDRAVRGFQEAAQKNPGLKSVFDWAEQNYSAEEIAKRNKRPVSEEEAMETRMGEGLVETVGRVNAGLVDINKLDSGFRQVLIDFINKVAEFIGMKPILKDTDLATFKRTISKVADALKSGRDISEVVGAENVMMYELRDTREQFSNTSTQGRFTTEFFEDTKSFEDLVNDGFVVHNSELSDFSGETVVIHNPDSFSTGKIKFRDKDLVEGEGGIYFVLKYGDVWASSKQATAKQMANLINESLEKSTDGKARIVLVKGASGKNLTSVKGAKALMGVLEILADDGLIPLNVFRKALNIAGKKYKINFDGRSDAKSIHKDIQDKFMNVSNSSFERRGDFAADVIDEIDKQIEAFKDNIPAIAESIGATRKMTRFSKASIIDSVAYATSERILRDIPNSHVYAVIESSSPVTIKNVGKHESYPWHIVTEDGSKPVLYILKNRQYFDDVFVAAKDTEKVRSGERFENVSKAGLAQRGMGLAKVEYREQPAVQASVGGRTIGTISVQDTGNDFNGMPISIVQGTIFHRTSAPAQSIIDGGFVVPTQGRAKYGYGVYFNIEPKETMYGENHIAADLSGLKMLDLTQIDDIDQVSEFDKLFETDRGMDYNAVTNELKVAGIDGVISSSEAVVFDPSKLSNVRDVTGQDVESLKVQPTTQASVGNRQAIIDQAKAAGTYLKAPNGKPTKLTEDQWTTVRTPEFKNWFGDWENDPENASKVVDENGEPMVVYHGTRESFDSFDRDRLGSRTGADSARMAFFFTDNPEVAESYPSGERDAMSSDRVSAIWGGGVEGAQDALDRHEDSIPFAEYDEEEAGFIGRITEYDRFGSEYTYDADGMVYDTEQEAIDAANKELDKERTKLEGRLKAAIYEFERRKEEYQAGMNLIPSFLNIKNPYYYDFGGSYDTDKNTEIVAEAVEEGSDGVWLENADVYLGNRNLPSNVFAVFKPTQIKSATANIGAFSPTDARIQMSAGGRRLPVGTINWERSPEGKGDPSISSRNPIVTKAAQDLKAGLITNEEYRATVSENSPIIPITRFFEPATEKEIRNAFSVSTKKDTEAENIGKPIDENKKVGLRLDIPSYQYNNTWVVSVHEGHTRSGKIISYGNVAKIKNVLFEAIPIPALNIATGEVSKTSVARMYGEWENIEGNTLEEKGESAKKMIQDIVDDPSYVQVGMNPFRHSYFYDRNTDMGRPIVSAEEVIQVGGLVYAKNPVYGEWTDESYRVKELFDAAGAPVQFSVGGRVENDTNFKLAAFVMRKKDEGASTVELVTSIASVMPGMSPQDIQSLINDPEAWLKSKFPGMTPEQQDNLIATAKRQNIYRGRKFGKPIDPAYHGLHVPDEMVEEYTKRNRRRDNAVKELFDRVFSKAYFTSSKGMPDWFLQVKDMATGAKNIEIERAAKTIEKLRKVAKSIGFSDWDTFSKALKDAYGTAPMGAPGLPMPVAAPGMPPLPMAPVTVPPSIAALPAEIIPFVYAMRGQIDNLTRDLIGFGYVTPEQAITLQKNIGAYVNRSYRLFTEKGYKPDKKAIDAAVKYFVDEKLKEIATDKAGAITLEEAQQQALDQAMKMVDDILDRKTNPYFRPSEVDRRNPGILKQKQNIPEPIRRLMGEYTDPGLVFMLTVGKQAALKASSQYLSEMRKNGMGTIFFEKDDPNRPLTHNIEVATMGSEALAPLGGLYTTQEVYDALMSMEPTYNNLTQVWMKTVGIVRWSKTVASLATQMKNVESNLGFAVMNGLLMTGSSFDAFKGSIKYVKNQYSPTEIDEITEKAIKLNLVGQAVGARELAEMLGSGDIHDVALDVALGPEGRWGRRVAKRINPVRMLNKAYRLGDDFWKVYAYMNERQLVSRGRFDGAAYESLTPEQQDQVDAESSERVKNTWPTYDRVIEAAKFVSKRAPIVGNFISFQAESLRVLANTIKLAAQDIKDPQMRESGIRRMVGITSYVSLRTAITLGVAKFFGFAASGLLGAAFGDDDEERRKGAIKYAMPTFSRTGDLLTLPKKDAPHRYTVVNLSDLDPYGIIPRAFNALTEGREGIFGKTMEPGVPAAIAELFSSFLEPEMTFNAIWSLMNNNNIQTGERIVNESDSPSEVYDKAMGYLWKQLKPSTYAIYERLRDGGSLSVEALALFGMRPYEVDLHKSWDYALSAMGRDMDAVIKEFNRVSYDDKATPEQKQAALVEAEMKKGIIINKYHEVYKNFILTGANPDILNQKLDEKSRTRMTGFDNLTKDALKTNKISSQFFKLKQDKQEKKEGYVEEGKSMEYKEEKPAEYKPE